jgi:hypothetical protein
MAATAPGVGIGPGSDGVAGVHVLARAAVTRLVRSSRRSWSYPAAEAGDGEAEASASALLVAWTAGLGGGDGTAADATLDGADAASHP